MGSQWCKTLKKLLYIYLEVSVISKMISCFYDFYLEPSWSSFFFFSNFDSWFKLLVCIFFIFKQINLIYILIFKKQIIIDDLVFLLISQIFWNVIFPVEYSPGIRLSDK